MTPAQTVTAPWLLGLTDLPLSGTGPEEPWRVLRGAGTIPLSSSLLSHFVLWLHVGSAGALVWLRDPMQSRRQLHRQPLGMQGSDQGARADMQDNIQNRLKGPWARHGKPLPHSPSVTNNPKSL